MRSHSPIGTGRLFLKRARTVARGLLGPGGLISFVTMLPTIDWTGETVVMIDQRKLAAYEVYVTCKTAQD